MKLALILSMVFLALLLSGCQEPTLMQEGIAADVADVKPAPAANNHGCPIDLSEDCEDTSE